MVLLDYNIKFFGLNLFYNNNCNVIALYDIIIKEVLPGN